jgi:hypothetical protein
MSSEEFWSLTWEEYLARDERFLEEQQRWDERFGIMPSVYVNAHSKEGAKPKHAGFFFGYPEPTRKPVGDSEREMTTEQQIAAWRVAFPVKSK